MALSQVPEETILERPLAFDCFYFFLIAHRNFPCSMAVMAFGGIELGFGE